jgi:hypothetical protein
MLEVQLAMLGLLILKSLIALIEVICIQIVCLFKSYYISTKDLNEFLETRSIYESSLPPVEGCEGVDEKTIWEMSIFGSFDCNK